jgi:hypothetical protein
MAASRWRCSTEGLRLSDTGARALAAGCKLKILPRDSEITEGMAFEVWGVTAVASVFMRRGFMASIFALVDCNNLYASRARVSAADSQATPTAMKMKNPISRGNPCEAI